MPPLLPPATPRALADLAVFKPDAIVSQVLHKTPGGAVTLLAFAAGEGLREHTNPDDALVIVVEGEAHISVADAPHAVRAGEAIRLPGGVPHAVAAVSDLRLLLVLLKTPRPSPA